MTPMTWEEKIRMAKEADPTLTDEKAAEVVRDLEALAHLAWDSLKAERAAKAAQTGTPQP